MADQPLSAPSGWKDILASMRGAKVTGFATGAVGGRLVNLTLTLDNGTAVDFYASMRVGPFIDVTQHPYQAAPDQNQLPTEGT